MPVILTTRHPAPPTTRALDEGALRALLGGWLVLLAFTLAWDFSGMDVAVMRLIGTAAGFPLQHHPLLENLLHDRLRQTASVALVLAWIWALLPARFSALPAVDRRLAVVLVTAGLLAVNLIKNRSATSCPWDWQMFGGSVDVVSHWAWGLRDGGPGRCFPGGHASSGMAFVALALPWLAPRQKAASEASARRGWQCLTMAVAAGLLCGTVQTLRGAHPPSHTLWTLLICSGVALAGWSMWPVGQRRGAPLPAKPQAQGQVDQHADHDGPEHATAPEEPGRTRRR
ncbi:phosphatase PAP2 family protein [uncultured Hydrogenophaga sp.]|uniref:phosphatase PAP2 family protein n=1 Tax=uncultured Hydrogenophaga sp. TaxID=199683 RepID=UPI00265EE87D|nr:phosphatase PAP2 family protein [uncultured Hydrogenophaga sp.]